MGNQQEISEVEKAWLAGIIEGDGSISMGFLSIRVQGESLDLPPSRSSPLQIRMRYSSSVYRL